MNPGVPDFAIAVPNAGTFGCSVLAFATFPSIPNESGAVNDPAPNVNAAFLSSVFLSESVVAAEADAEGSNGEGLFSFSDGCSKSVLPIFAGFSAFNAGTGSAGCVTFLGSSFLGG